MEQSILENSKGATYMSFILDIEIVIKKDGTRANLAETKAKSQVSKKKDGESKDPYASSRNQDVKVYTASEQPRKNIFELPLGNDKESKLSESNKDPNAKMDRFEKTTNKSVNKSDYNENKTIQNKENIPGNINGPEKTDTVNIVEKTSVSDGANLVPNNVRPKKKKISKAEKKAKVFKGKVEPIDFLECNRIFMCNYFKIPISRNRRSFDVHNRSSDSKVIESEGNSSQVNGVNKKSHSTQKIDKQIFKTLKQNKFWKKNFSTSHVNRDSKPDKYSLGDGHAINASHNSNSNEFELGELNTIENSDSTIPERSSLLRKTRLISEFKFNESKNNSSSRRDIAILHTEENQNVSTTECSNTLKEQVRKTKVLRKSKSTPKIKESTNFQNLNCAKSDINQYKGYKKRFSFIKALKNKTNSSTCTTKEGLLGLTINCFNDVDFVLIPQLNDKNVNSISSNCSENNIFSMKEENPPDEEKHTNEKIEVLGEISKEIDNIIETTQGKGYSEMQHKLKNSSPVLKDSISSTNINMSNMKNDEIDGKYDEPIAVNTKKCPSIKNNVLPDLQLSLISNPDTCTITPQINFLSQASKENYLEENKCQLGVRSYDNHLESEDFNQNISDENNFRTVPTLSLENALSERLVKICDLDISQTAIEKQTTDKSKKRKKQGGKSKTKSFIVLETLHGYMKNVKNKFMK